MLLLSHVAIIVDRGASTDRFFLHHNPTGVVSYRGNRVEQRLPKTRVVNSTDRRFDL